MRGAGGMALSALGTFFPHGHNSHGRYHTLVAVLAEPTDNFHQHSAQLHGRRLRFDWPPDGAFIRERSRQREGVSWQTAVRMETRQVDGQPQGLAYAGIGADSLKGLKSHHMSFCARPVGSATMRSQLTLVVKDAARPPHEQHAFIVACLVEEAGGLAVRFDAEGTGQVYARGGNKHGFEALQKSLGPRGRTKHVPVKAL